MPTKGVTTNFNKAVYRQTKIWQTYYTFYRNIALTVNAWDGLPDTMNERYLEQTLFEKGIAGFYMHPYFGAINSTAVAGGQINFYGEPTVYEAVAPTLSFSALRSKMGVVRNNPSCVPTNFQLMELVDKLVVCEMGIQMNTQQQKVPNVILCDERERLTFKNLIMQADGYQPFIYGFKNLDIDQIKLLELNPKYLVDKLDEHKALIVSEIYTLLGINNTAVSKTERLVSDEVSANDEQVSASAYSQLLGRQMGADEFNKLYGTNIQPYRREFSQDVEIATESPLSEVHADE